jgi:hypothetical protein
MEECHSVPIVEKLCHEIHPPTYLSDRRRCLNCGCYRN